MSIKPMIRNNICLNSDPGGCCAFVMRQIEYVKKHFLHGTASEGIPRLALVIGCSTGYGLASRIVAGFGYGAATVGVSLEKPASETKTGTPGFYMNRSFDDEAVKAGIVSITLNGDAFSDVLKAQVIEALKKAAAEAGIPPKVDLLVYSLASPVRTDPKTGITHRALIKPIGASFSGKSIDIISGALTELSLEPATEEEIINTVKVMGGEDWELWMEALSNEDLLSAKARVLAYSYLGPESSWPIYKNGSIGRAKEDLERAAAQINKSYTATGKIAGAWISINKALVTRSSAIIPVIPVYLSCLYRIMKEKGLHEGCIEQIMRLYRDRLYSAEAQADPRKIPTDSSGRIRLDDWEMREDVQKAVMEKMKNLSSENLYSETDLEGFRRDFLETHGFSAI